MNERESKWKRNIKNVISLLCFYVLKWFFPCFRFFNALALKKFESRKKSYKSKRKRIVHNCLIDVWSNEGREVDPEKLVIRCRHS